MILKFKEWLSKESIFGQPVDEPAPDPEHDPDCKRSNQAFPTYEVPAQCKKQKKQKKQKKMKKSN